MPTYSYQAPYVILTLFREARAALLEGGMLAALSPSEREGWDWLATQNSVSTAEYQEAMGIPNRTARNHMRKLCELGLLKPVGAGRARRYEVVR